jgi:hypothetical protein
MRAGRTGVLEKGGNLPGSALRAKVGYKIAQRPVAHAELPSDFRRGLAADKVGPENFVAALQGLIGIEEELLADQVVHDLASKMSPSYWERGWEMLLLNLDEEQAKLER